MTQDIIPAGILIRELIFFGIFVWVIYLLFIVIRGIVRTIGHLLYPLFTVIWDFVAPSIGRVIDMATAYLERVGAIATREEMEEPELLFHIDWCQEARRARITNAANLLTDRYRLKEYWEEVGEGIEEARERAIRDGNPEFVQLADHYLDICVMTKSALKQ